MRAVFRPSLAGRPTLSCSHAGSFHSAGIGLGFWAASIALIGAGLDNLADASVYAVSLYAVARAVQVKIRAARLSGFLLIGLAVMLFAEVLRRFFGNEEPVGPAMMAIAAANAILNLACLRSSGVIGVKTSTSRHRQS